MQLQRIERNVATEYLREWYAGCASEQHSWNQLSQQSRSSVDRIRVRASEELKRFTEPNCINLRTYFWDDIETTAWRVPHRWLGSYDATERAQKEWYRRSHQGTLRDIPLPTDV